MFMYCFVFGANAFDTVGQKISNASFVFHSFEPKDKLVALVIME